MKNFHRDNTLFSLCGLNCGLCTMHIGGYCPGCGGGEGNQSCAIARCGIQHGNAAYCCACEDYPCAEYADPEQYDSFVIHRTRARGFEKFQRVGLEAYMAELNGKIKALNHLLENYNDGRRKNFYVAAVSLLELADIQAVMEQIAAMPELSLLAVKEKAGAAAKLFERMAQKRDVVLKFNRNSPDKK
jgi:hypothetical protein